MKGYLKGHHFRSGCVFVASQPSLRTGLLVLVADSCGKKMNLTHFCCDYPKSPCQLSNSSALNFHTSYTDLLPKSSMCCYNR